MENQSRIKYLESCISKNRKIREKIEAKHSEKFQKYARYLGNGVYTWRGIYATDTRELFLMGVLEAEGITFNENE